ncbi:MAG: GW dipeptide domain-containing protein [Bacteroidia bacterium]
MSTKTMIRMWGLLAMAGSWGFAFGQTTARIYPHKVTVDSVIQTRSYTYLKVAEKIRDKDSLLWMALPTIAARPGDVYYYESGLAMGRFPSKELNRTFSQILFLACLSTTDNYDEKSLVPPPVHDSMPKKAIQVPTHIVNVKEVLQTSGYTYLRVMEGNKEEWLAVVKLMASPGQTYAYSDAAPMKEFYSRELKRTFPEVLFLSKLTLQNSAESEEGALPASHPDISKSGKAKGVSAIKAGNKISPPEGGISIGELWKNKNKYAGKKVKIKGEVTKYSANILEKNWIHLEDGSSFGEAYDITVTTTETVKVGDIVTMEGIVSLSKDFGYGYYFEVIIEEALHR